MAGGEELNEIPNSNESNNDTTTAAAAANQMDYTRQQQQTENSNKMDINTETISSQRVFKKSLPNNKMTLYLSSRELTVTESEIEKLQGVILVDPEFVGEKRVYGLVCLTFRYGREDEEVMGLKFCNEAMMSLAQLYPPHPSSSNSGDAAAVTPLQDALIKRLGPNAYPFTMEMNPMAPPSVRLVPAKIYNGAPIGTSYDVRAYLGERPDDVLQRKTTIRMGIRVVQKPTMPPAPVLFRPPQAVHEPGAHANSKRQLQYLFRRTSAAAINHNHCYAENKEGPMRNGNKDDHTEHDDSRCENSPHPIKTFNEQSPTNSSLGKQSGEEEFSAAMSVPAPRAAINKPFLLSEGRLALDAWLDRAFYSHGQSINAHVIIRNHSSRTVRRIKISVVQQVDVCMFSNGKFKNIVALVNSREGFPLSPNSSLNKVYRLEPEIGPTKNWIALEDSYSKSETSLASTAICNTAVAEDRNVFAIYVSYYVKVKLAVSVMGGAISLKLPFTLVHSCAEDASEQQGPSQPAAAQQDIKPEKDGT